MKALTLWQPWASLVAIGAKPYEFRSWRPPQWMIGREMAIHASARPVRKSEVSDIIARMENSAYLSTVCLRDEALPFLRNVLEGLGYPSGDLFSETRAITLPRSAIVATVRVGAPKIGADCAREFGYTGPDNRDESNWGWPMLDVKPLVPTPEAKGAQGLWDWREHV